jgi:hypothetical protein
MVKTRRKQKGGDWYNPMSWFSSSSDPYAPKKSWSDWWSETTGSAENALSGASQSAQNMMSSANQYLSQDVNVTGTNNSQNNQYVANGGKSKKNRSKKGGNRGLGITYYATPVSDYKTAQPTYWIKGGKKKSKRINNSKKTKRSKTRRQKSRVNRHK